MPKLFPKYRKTLKLINPVAVNIPIDKVDQIGIIIEREQNYIRNKGAIPVGPVIQYISAKQDNKEKLDFSIQIIQQSNKYIEHTEQPYRCDKIIEVSNCMYLRYQGTQEKLQIAYDKLTVTAYEDEFELDGSSFTVFVNEENDIITADIFMPLKNQSEVIV